MVAKVTAKIRERVSNAVNMCGEKETVATYNLVTVHKSKPVDAVCVRVYMGRSRNASAVYASIWVKCADGEWTSGRGSAGGYGYHKESQAIANALANAGIELFGDPYMRDESRNKDRLFFGGTGSSGYETIFSAVAKAAGYRGKKLLVSN